MTHIDQDDSGITEQAARWVALLKDGNESEQAAFGAWLKVSPRHVEEFLLVAAAEHAFDELRQGRSVDAAAILAAVNTNVVSLEGRELPADAAPTAKATRTRRRWLAAAGIAVASVAAVGWALATYPRWYGYSTSIGEQRIFELQDGSVIHLNTQSRVKVHLSASQREIRLVRGEALFRVAHDAARPFRVHVRNGVIQAIGTRFNVYQAEQQTTVSVIEGLVRISKEGPAAPIDAGVRPQATAPAPDSVSPKSGREAGMDGAQLFAAGEGATIAAADGKVTRQEKIDAIKVSAWRQRRLVFRGDRLAQVADEFNRYNPAPRIRVEGQRAADKQMAGVFDADDPESLLLFLSQYGDLSVERRSGQVVIRGSDAANR